MITNESNLNSVNLIGELAEDFTYSHEARNGLTFFTSTVRVERQSGVSDYLPIVVQKKLLDDQHFEKGDTIELYGEFRSRNQREGNRLILEVYVKKIRKSDISSLGVHFNQITVDGYLCKTPIYRETPLGREICDILIASNRGNGKSDYLPAITWGRNAIFTRDCFSIGSGLSITGRLQSREYQKKVGEDKYETRTAYEISVNQISFIQ